ncbi:Alpha/Beta hydrolase protein [Ilyonectria sp. MPI-CAGE-AT-0026]|nr:Alpha/Beta hydrolase protein [Ilyonectria sp. MPI-CAGE-AT-0026]
MLFLSLIISWLTLEVLASTASSSALPSSRNTPIVTLKNGSLSGTVNRHYSQDFFLGIPYAAPPVGNLRLRKPHPAMPWTGIRKSESYGAGCIRNSIELAGFSQNFTGPVSEDCLHLNIIRPSKRHSLLPVLVWIHGGGFQDGSASDGRSNGTFLVQASVEMGTPIIFVSLNYRLGAFGMLAGSVMEEAGLANIALYDQRQALHWIQENIRHFGGDASRVTIMGESAGAMSVGFHLLAFGGRDDGLFRAAIAQSGGPFTAPVLHRSISDREADLTMVLNKTGCLEFRDSLKCLREAPVELLQESGALLPVSFTVDGGIVPEASEELLHSGRFVRVPLLTGSTRNEGTSLLQQALRVIGPLDTEKDLKRFIQTSWFRGPASDNDTQRWAELYQQEIISPSPAGLGTVKSNPGPQYGSSYGAATLWLGDMMFTAGRRFANQAWAKANIPSYSFLFDAVPANMDPDTLGAAHFAEIPYMFRNMEGFGWETSPFPDNPSLRKNHEKLAELMSRMWISFATKQDPNFHQVPGLHTNWPVYDNKTPLNIVFSTKCQSYIQTDNWRAEAINIMSLRPGTDLG